MEVTKEPSCFLLVSIESCMYQSGTEEMVAGKDKVHELKHKVSCKQPAHKAFFTEDILTCRSRKSTGVKNFINEG